MPAAATENRVIDAVITRLQTIGTPPSSWNVATPEVAEGVPPDPVPVPNKARLYVEHSRTDPTNPDAGTASHYHRVSLVVWCVAKTPRDVATLKSDVLRALFAGEGTFTASFGQPMWPGEFVQRRDLSDAGVAVGQQVVFVDVELTHSAP